MYVDIPGYTAILFRRTYRDLNLPSSLMDRAHQWLRSSDAHWNGTDYSYTFPSGARIVFGYMENEADKYRYQSSEVQMCAFDEVTEFSETQYQWMFSRLRRLEGSDVPLRMRCASNPGGIGHDWVKQRFIIEGEKNDRLFVPATLEDNPFIDQVSYEASLNRLDYVTKRQLRYGDWDIRSAGNKFKRQWFRLVDDYPRVARRVRYWDLAATTPKSGTDPDYTVGVLLAETDGQYYVVDVKRIRGSPKDVEQLVKQTAELDGHGVQIYMEQEPGSSGVASIDHYAREVLKGYPFRALKTTGSKEVRANPLSAAAEMGNVFVLKREWSTSYLDEMELFPTTGSHDDQCLRKGTLISTNIGAKPIEDIVKGDSVLTRKGYRKVEWSGCTGDRFLLKIVLNNGATLFATKQHPIFVDGKGFICCDAISVADELCILQPSPSTAEPTTDTLKATRVATASTTKTTHDGKKHPFISTGKSGDYTTETSLKATPSTIETEIPSTTTYQKIPSTTTYQILNVSEVPNTIPNIPKTSGKTPKTNPSENDNLNTLPTFENSQRFGIVRQKDTNGTSNMQRQAFAQERKEPSPAPYVKNSSLYLQPEHGYSFAQDYATSDIGTDIQTRSRIASFAEKLFQQPRSLSEKPVLENVAVSSMEPLMEDGQRCVYPVYNLKVEDENEYFANGILVHNCDASSGAFEVLSGRMPHGEIQVLHGVRPR